mmetsp:Transcript_3004/g.4566  ORF Transcript_3004/g.4566 Transcript_3004/m.4566 type:complete len:82 (-) Transcript_3004:293-538(-)
MQLSIWPPTGMSVPPTNPCQPSRRLMHNNTPQIPTAMSNPRLLQQLRATYSQFGSKYHKHTTETVPWLQLTTLCQLTLLTT